MVLHMNLRVATKGMHLWIWILHMHNIDSLTTARPISRINAPHIIIVAKKVVSHVIVVLKYKIIIF